MDLIRKDSKISTEKMAIALGVSSIIEKIFYRYGFWMRSDPLNRRE